MAKLDAAVEFAPIPDARCACVLLLDPTYSMTGPAIDSLSAGLQVLRNDIQGDDLAMQRAAIADVSFGDGVRTVQDFVIACACQLRTLRADGATPMRAGSNMAIDFETG